MSGAGSGPSGPAQRRHLLLPFEAESVPVARHQVVAGAHAAGLSGDVVLDIALVVTELATNAVDHGAPTPEGQFEVGWRIGDGRVVISVRDAGPGDDVAARPPSRESLRGRGLAIVDALCERWDTDRTAGLRVTAELRYDR